MCGNWYFDFGFVIESIREGKYNNSNLDSDIWLERIKFCRYLRRKNVDVYYWVKENKTRKKNYIVKGELIIFR